MLADEKYARAALTYLAEPADRWLAQAVIDVVAAEGAGTAAGGAPAGTGSQPRFPEPGGQSSPGGGRHRQAR